MGGHGRPIAAKRFGVGLWKPRRIGVLGRIPRLSLINDRPPGLVGLAREGGRPLGNAGAPATLAPRPCALVVFVRGLTSDVSEPEAHAVEEAGAATRGLLGSVEVRPPIGPRALPIGG